MFNLLEYLPVDVAGAFVFGLLKLSDLVRLEKACGSKASRKAFLNMIPYCSPLILPESKQKYNPSLQWFAKRSCTIQSLTITIPGNNPCLHVKNLQVEKLDLCIESYLSIEKCQPLFESNMTDKINTIVFNGEQYKDVIQQLAFYTNNIVKMSIFDSRNRNDWFNKDMLSCWKLKEISLNGTIVTALIVTLIFQTCTELTSIKLSSYNMIDTTVFINVTHHCPKLQNVIITINSTNTYHNLIALSENCTILTELNISTIPDIPNIDIGRRCSHALSCIHYISTKVFDGSNQDASMLLAFLTGLTSVELDNECDSYIPLLTQHCNKLTKLTVHAAACLIGNILSLCHANPLLQEVHYYSREFTDTVLIELIHACPHLRILRLPYETAITDKGILALSEHCPHFWWLNMRRCAQVTEAAVLQLLQRCRKLTSLEVSSSSLSEET